MILGSAPTGGRLAAMGITPVIPKPTSEQRRRLEAAGMKWDAAADWLPPSASDPAAQGGVFLSGLHVPDGASDSGTSGAATRPVPAAASPAGASAPPQRAAATKWGGEVRPAAPGRPNFQPPDRSGAVSADGRSPSELTLGTMLTGRVAEVFEKLRLDGAPADLIP